MLVCSQLKVGDLELVIDINSILSLVLMIFKADSLGKRMSLGRVLPVEV